jgi:hypothetical protein
VKVDGLENSWILPIYKDLKLRREEEEEKRDVDRSSYIYRRCNSAAVYQGAPELGHASALAGMHVSSKSGDDIVRHKYRGFNR